MYCSQEYKNNIFHGAVPGGREGGKISNIYFYIETSNTSNLSKLRWKAQSPQKDFLALGIIVLVKSHIHAA